jgi:hypothetical protein
MPIGLTNALRPFQAAMNESFCPFLRKFVLVFCDDILICSKTWTDAQKHVDLVLTILEKNSFIQISQNAHLAKEKLNILGI